MSLSRQQKLRIIQQVHSDWWDEHPEVEYGELGSEEAEAELFNRINRALAIFEEPI